MAAPTGVNEGLPQEPAKAGAELAEPEPAPTEPGETAPAEAGDKAGPTGVVPAGVIPPQAEPAPAAEVVAGPADAGSAEAMSPQARSPEAEPEVSGPAEAEPAGPEWDAEERRRDVSPLAVAGIILGVIALVGVAAGVLVVITHGFRPKTAVTVTYRPPAVFGLRPGQCVDTGSSALKVTVLSCARPHDAEVYAVYSLPATAWPGASTVEADASDGCASLLSGYIDPQLAAASLTQEFVYPDKGAWRAGERTVVCEVSSDNGQLTGSLRAKG